MFHDEFYPTPPAIAKRVLQKVNCHGKNVLDPSCGKGDMVKTLTSRDFYFEFEKNGHGMFVTPSNVFGIELIPDLQEISKSHGIRILGDDFFDTEIDFAIDVIYMNPPFSNGDKHLLRAWDIVAPGGTVVCLLNLETITNPYSKTRQMLNKIIVANGKVENWGKCFKDAEKTTNVDVACVILNKPEEKERFKYKGDFEKEKKINLDSTDLTDTGGLVKMDLIDALVDAYSSSKIEFENLLIQLSKTNTITNAFARPNGSGNINIPEILKNYSHNPQTTYNTFCADLKRKAWAYIIEKTKIREIATSKLKSDLDKFLNEQSDIAFNKKNITAVVEMLYLNGGTYMYGALVDVFDKLCSYDAENKTHWEGWKTNDSYKVNYKVIYPWGVTFDKTYSSRPWSFNHRNGCFFDDLDIALCFVSGNKIDNIHGTEKAIRNAIERSNNNYANSTKGESTFFEFQFYKKGTIHLWFKDEETWTRFNVMAAEGKHWLPPNDVKQKEAEECEAVKRKKNAEYSWIKREKEQNKREKYLKEQEINFNPPNTRGTELLKNLLEYIDLSKNEYANVIIVNYEKFKLEILDNSGSLKVQIFDNNNDLLDYKYFDIRDDKDKLIEPAKISAQINLFIEEQNYENNPS